MRMSASWLGLRGPPNTRLRRDRSRQSGLPSDRHPDRTESAVVLGPVKDKPSASETREELYYNKEKLLANGDRWEREITKMLELDAPYR